MEACWPEPPGGSLTWHPNGCLSGCNDVIRAQRRLLAGAAIATVAVLGQAAEPATAPAPERASAADAAAVPDSATATHRPPPAVCFKLTLHCFDSKKAPIANAGSAGATGNSVQSDHPPEAANDADGDSARKPPLNLNAPDVRTVIPAQELKEPLPTIDEQVESQESTTVSVKGEAPGPDVPLGFGALWWAVRHPSDAWRIFTPVE